jgi:hypothetical protein
VKPEDYPAPLLMKVLSDLVGMAQIIAGLAVFVRSKDCPNVMTNNKIATVFVIWLGGSMVRSTLTKTGAFEVYLGQKLVWSSIAKKDVPEVKDLVASFKGAGVEI